MKYYQILLFVELLIFHINLLDKLLNFHIVYQKFTAYVKMFLSPRSPKTPSIKPTLCNFPTGEPLQILPRPHLWPYRLTSTESMCPCQIVMQNRFFPPTSNISSWKFVWMQQFIQSKILYSNFENYLKICNATVIPYPFKVWWYPRIKHWKAFIRPLARVLRKYANLYWTKTAKRR